jgi:hypothetical protein
MANLKLNTARGKVIILTESSVQSRVGIWRFRTALLLHSRLGAGTGNESQVPPQCDLTANGKETTHIIMQPPNLARVTRARALSGFIARVTRARASSGLSQEAGVSIFHPPSH